MIEKSDDEDDEGGNEGDEGGDEVDDKGGNEDGKLAMKVKRSNEDNDNKA